VLLFYDAKLKWGWALFYVGLALILIEILSRIRFQMGMPVSNLLLMLGMVAAGIGMMLRSFRDMAPEKGPPAGS
jgi:NhaP-type Na+/H+ and K+/H+ antiporter